MSFEDLAADKSGKNGINQETQALFWFLTNPQLSDLISGKKGLDLSLAADKSG